MQRKIAFTLAEVLITLGIIGIVAAMTLPGLINKSEKVILKNQFKKAYSVYSQALLKTTSDDEGGSSCYYGENEDEIPTNTGQDHSGCNDFYEKFAKNMKIIKKCENNALANECIPKYSNFSTSDGCGGFSEEAFNVTNTAYVLADGSILMPYYQNNMALFAFDVNGKKGPNKPGFDLFSLNITRTQKGVYRFYTGNLTGCLPVLPGKLSYEDIFK